MFCMGPLGAMTIHQQKNEVVPSGFEPLSQAPKAHMITATPRDYVEYAAQHGCV
jgi:hypothetical protein